MSHENSAANSIIHSHTNGENFSKEDIIVAKERNIHIYVVAPTKDKGTAIKKADKYENYEIKTVVESAYTIKLSSVTKRQLKEKFSNSWESHKKMGCTHGYNCAKEKWPREDRNYKVY